MEQEEQSPAAQGKNIVSSQKILQQAIYTGSQSVRPWLRKGVRKYENARQTRAVGLFPKTSQNTY